jgi:hypothetical protein
MSAEDGAGVPALEVEIVPIAADGFGMRLSLPKGEDVTAVIGPSGRLAIRRDCRVIRAERREHLLVLEGRIAEVGPATHVLSSHGPAGESVRLVVPRAPVWGRELCAMLRTVLGAFADGAGGWQPLIRYLGEASRQATRAVHSIPIGMGMALVLDGALDEAPAETVCFVRDGDHLAATEARVAVCDATRRTVVFAPAIGARYYLQLDDELVEIACPHQATRTAPAAAAGAHPLAAGEADLLMTLVARCGGGGDLPPLPAARALPSRWEWTSGAAAVAVEGLLPVEGGTAAFVSVRSAAERLDRVVAHDLAGAAAPLIGSAPPLAAVRAGGRSVLRITAMLPQRFPGGVGRLSVAGDGSSPAWLRLLEPAGAEAARLAAEWAPPPGQREDYGRAVVLPMRTAALARPALVARLATTASGRADGEAAGLAVVLLALAATVEAVERSMIALALTLPSGSAGLAVAVAAGRGFVATAARIDNIARAFGVGVEIAAAAPAVGACAALGAAVSGRSGALVVLEAGLAPRRPDWADDLSGSRRNSLVLPPASLRGAPLRPAAAFTGTAIGLLGEVDPRIASLAAVLDGVRAAAAAAGIAVIESGALDLAAVAEPAGDPFNSWLDRGILADGQRARAGNAPPERRGRPRVVRGPRG